MSASYTTSAPPKRWRKPWTIRAGWDVSPSVWRNASLWLASMTAPWRPVSVPSPWPPPAGITTPIAANNFLGLVYFLQGDYRQAMDANRRAMALLEGEQRYERFGQAILPAVRCRTYLSLCLAEVGAFAEGIAVGEEGLHIAEAVTSRQPCGGISKCRPAIPPPGESAPGAAAARTRGGPL